MTANFGGVDVVPLQGTIVVCDGWGGEGNDQLWGSHCRPILGEWTWCHCWVPL